MLKNCQSICLFCFSSLIISCNTYSEVKNDLITLKEYNLINETAEGNVSNLIDNNIATRWFPGKKEIYYPAFCTIDLGCEFVINKLRFYSERSFGQRSLELFIGEPFKWKKLRHLNLSNVYNWTDYDTTIFTRYIRIKIDAPNTLINELKLYGNNKRLNCDSIAILPNNNFLVRKATVGDIIGINGFVDDPIDRYTPAGFIREYHNWNWTDSNSDTLKFPNNEVRFAKSYGYWDFDLYYENLYKQGIDVYPVIKENIKYLWHWDKDTKPVDPNYESVSPEAYRAHADHLFQYAARYGKSKINGKHLKLAKGQEIKSGLGFIEYYENWNEPDMWWGNKKHYFTPYEFAAMTSMDYDGHLGKYGKTLGIKNADKNAKLVLGGLAKLNIDYIKAIMFWSKHNRSDSLPFDVINFHHYSHNQKDLHSNPLQSKRIGISPEEDSLRYKISEIVKFRDQYLPGKEVWVTEFGYDTHPQSPHRAGLVNGFSRDEVQGIWLVRSFLELIAAGVDKAAMYMIRDTNNANANQFSSSGLTKSKKQNWIKKPSWYYLNTLSHWLNDMIFSDEKILNINKTKCYRFINNENNEIAYVIWHYDNSVDSITYNLALENNQYINVIELNDNSYGKEVIYTNRDSITVSISQKPLIVLARKDNKFKKKSYHQHVSKEEFEIDTVSVGNAGFCFDEQSKKQPKISWETGYDRKMYPAFFTLKFNKTLYLSHIDLYDTNSSGRLNIYRKINNNWELLKEDELKYGNQWKTFVINKNVKELKVEKESPFANFSEIKIFKEVFYD